MSSISDPNLNRIFELASARMGATFIQYIKENRIGFILAYSGGKDSNILYLFFKFLVETFQIKPPTLFYLSHGFREIPEVESQIKKFFLDSNYPNRFVKKKFLK
jgi:PP-loop superfamily ATP-utilizing enzyme